ncbi:MAG: HAMP domain-containing histidine kinase [Ruminiclostridium sp.]|nr:HAMP domain-containing histidine kinase [Ruminiclostridium sp.]
MISIRKRTALSYILVVILTVVILEALIIDIVRQNYYRNLESNLFSQVKASADIYYRYFSDASLNDNVLNNVDSFWKQTDVQVQIIDNSGKVLMDSIGILPEKGVIAADVEEALKTGSGSWIGNVGYDDESVMAVSYPLKSKENNIGILRFIASLREVNREIHDISRIFIIIGALVAFLSAIIGILLSNTIVGPLKLITGVAEKMASGDFLIHSKKIYDDELGKLSDTLNYMAEEIVKRDRLKNEFISSVSHELRTPLTSIKGWAVTLAESSPEDTATLKDGLDIIEKESDRLTAMVEELLDFSRFVTGKAAIRKDRVNLQDVVNHVVRQLQPRAERDGILLRLDLESPLPSMLTDGNRLKQIFINILDNSFKFTPAGGTVTFTAKYEEGKAIFCIKDTGCGIPPDELPNIREKFYKGRNSKTGNGIGLSICDEIIKLLNGSFEIKSKPGEGTEAVIILNYVDL